MVDDIKLPKREGEDIEDSGDDSVTEPTFAPPEAIAHDEEVIDMAEESSKPPSKDTAPKKPSKLKTKLKDMVIDAKLWWKDRSKKQKIIISALAVLLLAGAATGIYFLTKPAPAAKPAPAVAKKEEKKEPPKPTTEASHLTGVQVPPEYNQLPVTAVMIENSPDARPQSGLKDAGVVFEAIAEGGITRFLTLFQEAQPDYVGPVRSVRPYYLQWLQAFDAAVAHVGGSPEALAKVRNEGIKDLDQSFNGASYQRVSNRYAPHNVYTSLGSLIALGKSKGFNNSNFTGFARKAEKPSATPNAKVIDLAISSALYNAHYEYNATTNSYMRSEGGLPHKDERSGQQLNPKVVIALVMPQGIHPDGIHTTYGAIGSGTAFIFQDGIVTQGTWKKGSDKEQIKFSDAAGSPLGLNPGQTWLTAVGAVASVTFTP